jgi:hypothetical protein
VVEEYLTWNVVENTGKLLTTAIELQQKAQLTAEEKGFEPLEPLRVRRFSKPLPSTARPLLQAPDTSCVLLGTLAHLPDVETIAEMTPTAPGDCHARPLRQSELEAPDGASEFVHRAARAVASPASRAETDLAKWSTSSLRRARVAQERCTIGEIGALKLGGRPKALLDGS